APNGSSSSSTLGSIDRARAMPTRCFMPPEISPGRLCAAEVRPTRARAASVRDLSWARDSEAPNTRSTARYTFSKQVSHGSSEWFWNTTPRSGPGPAISRFAQIRLPCVGVVRPAMRLSKVDLPQPECPISATNSPLATVRLISRSATNGPLAVLKVCSTPWIWMYLVVRLALICCPPGRVGGERSFLNAEVAEDSQRTQRNFSCVPLRPLRHLCVLCVQRFWYSRLHLFESEGRRQLDQRKFEDQAHHADREDRDDDVPDVQVVPLIPDPEADADTAGEHFGGDDHEPGGADRKPHAGQHVGQHGGKEDLRDDLPLGQVQHPRDIHVVAGHALHADCGVDDHWPDRADEDGPDGGRVGALEHHQPDRQPGQRRHRPQQADQRVEHPRKKREAADHEAHRDPHQGGHAEAEGHTFE